MNNQLVSVGDIALNGGGTLRLAKSAGNSISGDWYVSGGSTLATNNHQNHNTAVENDEVLGSGKIYLDGSTLYAYKDGSNYNIRVSNDLVVSGNSVLSSEGTTEMYILGDITGNGNITENVSYSLYFYGDNSAYTGNWTITGDFVWGYNKYATKQDGWAGDGDYSFGSGTITINGGALGLRDDNGYIWNDIIVPAGKTTGLLKMANGAHTGNLTGNITGSGTIQVDNNNTQGYISLMGDNSAFEGTWKLLGRKVITHNTSATKVNGGDSAFGKNTIQIGTYTNNNVNYSGCIEAGEASTYIHNPINISGTLVTAPLSFEGKTLTLTGGLSGDSDITLSYDSSAGNTANRLRLLDGDNSSFSGDWHVKNVLLVTNAGNKSGEAFGTGTIYLEGGAGIVGWSANSTVSAHNNDARSRAYVYNDINVTGTNYLRSDGDAVNGVSPNFEVQLGGNLTGDGLLVRVGGGYRWLITGNNSAYTGDWLVQSDYLDTNNNGNTEGNSKGVDVRFGSGTMYLEGGGIQGGGAVFNAITVNSGKTGNLRNNGFTLGGVVSVNGTLNTNNQPITLLNKLQGTGTVQSSSVTMTNGSILAPGSIGVTNSDRSAIADVPVGTLTITGPLTMQEGSILNIDFASTTSFDKVLTSGNLSLDGVKVNLDFLDGFNAGDIQVGDTFEFISTTGADSLVDIQNILAPTYDSSVIADMYYGAQFDLVSTATGLALRASVNPTMVPEPATWIMLVFGMGAGLVAFRKKRNS